MCYSFTGTILFASLPWAVVWLLFQLHELHAGLNGFILDAVLAGENMRGEEYIFLNYFLQKTLLFLAEKWQNNVYNL